MANASFVQKAAELGVSWQAVIDSLRPAIPQIWSSLAVQERRRFLRHARPYWEVHRHRVAPEIGDLIEDLVQDGTVEIHAGRVTRYREDDLRAQITYHLRGSGERRTLHVDHVINCTGSETDCRRIDSSLLASLFGQGLAKPDILALGLDVGPNGALIGGNGHRSRTLFALGPVRKGCLWETTAVPEIRQQAEDLANHLITTLEQRAHGIEVVKTA